MRLGAGLGYVDALRRYPYFGETLRVSVFDDKYYKGWDGDVSDTDVPAVLPTALAVALETEYETDAHAAGYTLGTTGGEDWTPRMNKDAVRVPAVQAALRMCVGFIDLDRPNTPGASGHPPWPDTPRGTSDAHAAVTTLAALFPRCAVFSTRAGARLVYVLPEPCTVAAYIPYARAVLTQVQAVVAASGLALDVDTTTTQWTRVFRMPKVLRDGVRTSDAPYFAMRVPADLGPLPASFVNPAAAYVQPGVSVHEADPFADVERPALGDALSAEDWDALTEALGERLAARGYTGLLGKLRAGRTFYAPGTRNSATYRAVAALLDAGRSVPLDADGQEFALPPDAVYSMFEASTRATTGHTAPADALDELWDIVSRLCTASAYVEAGAEDTTNARLPQKMVPLDVPSEDGTKEVPLIVYTSGKGRYLWTGTRYSPPFSDSDSFRATFAHYWGNVYRGGASGPVFKLLSDYGTPVDDVVLDLGATAPKVEKTPMGTSLVLPMARRTDILPEYDADVAEWLTHLAGDDLEGVLDWLYWYPHLRENVCALFLCGAPSTGKSMLGTALAAFYGGEFVQFDKAVGTFTGQLRKTPLVWLDEGTNAKDAVDAFRRLVAASATQIERKHVDPETVRGCFRLFVTANKPSAIPLTDIKSVEDVDSILERVRYVHVADDAARYLKEKGGRTYTSDWVTRPDGTPGRLPGHIAWIQATRTPTVTPGARFRVQGKPTPWHYRALYNGDVGAVLAALATQVAKGLPLGKCAATYDRERDAVLVDPVAFMAVTREALRNEGVEMSDARSIFRSLSGGDEVEISGTAYLTLPKQLLIGMPRTEFREKDTAGKLAAIFTTPAPQEAP